VAAPQELLEALEVEVLEVQVIALLQILEQLILAEAEAHQVGETLTLEDQGLAVQEL
jgi:hypothetical protein